MLGLVTVDLEQAARLRDVLRESLETAADEDTVAQDVIEKWLFVPGNFQVEIPRTLGRPENPVPVLPVELMTPANVRAFTNTHERRLP